MIIEPNTRREVVSVEGVLRMLAAGMYVGPEEPVVDLGMA
jgi:hypothetical protein